MPYTVKKKCRASVSAKKHPKKVRLQKAISQRVKRNAQKTSKKVGRKACTRRKVAYFCTRNNGEVLKVLEAGKEIKKDSKFFIKKLAKNKKEFYLCTPQDREFIERLAGRFGEKRKSRFLKKNFAKSLQDWKRNSTFAPAS